MAVTMPPGAGKLKRSIVVPKENRLAHRHRDEGDESDKKDMAEVAARQNFGAVGLGLTLASELAKMIPEATCSALQSACLLNRTI